MAIRKSIAQWRVSKADPSGLTLWFDPMTEFPRLYMLEPSLRSGVVVLREGNEPTDQIQKYQQLSLLETELPPDGDVE